MKATLTNQCSPLLSDHTLGKEESPFTDFGHRGLNNIDLRVFQQDVFWVDAKGAPNFINEMPLDYLKNVKEFIIRNAESFYSTANIEDLERMMKNRDGTDENSIRTIQAQWESKWEVYADHVEWCEQSPLYKAISKILTT